MKFIFMVQQVHRDAEEKIWANALNQSLQFGPVRLKKIREYFGSFKNAWGASLSEIKKATDLEELEDFRKKIDPEKEFEILEKENIKVLLKNEFSRLLRETPFPPEILYMKGDLPEENFIHLAIVGTRKCSTYGKEACEKIIGELAEYKIVIVSGLAIGIDATAHKTAILNNMKTIGVLGCGLKENVFYPQENLKLSREIIEKGGCVVSEHPYTMKAARWTFRQRNRIVAGLSKGVFVVEAPEKSGTLITANFAVDYNREVFALPGSIFSANSAGTNKLIKAGAIPVISGADILTAFGIETEENKKEALDLSPLEEKIIFALTEPMTRDDLIRKVNLSPKEINPALGILEIRGIIKESGGEIFRM
jgi:DNA processing protein